jgi:hypothetical protein
LLNETGVNEAGADMKRYLRRDDPFIIGNPPEARKQVLRRENA